MRAHLFYSKNLSEFIWMEYQFFSVIYVFFRSTNIQLNCRATGVFCLPWMKCFNSNQNGRQSVYVSQRESGVHSIQYAGCLTRASFISDVICCLNVKKWNSNKYKDSSSETTIHEPRAHLNAANSIPVSINTCIVNGGVVLLLCLCVACRKKLDPNKNYT